MLAMLSDVVRNIVVLIILVTILELMLPKNRFRPFLNMVVGLVLMLMLLAPIRSAIQMPGALDPVWEMRLAITEEEVEARQAMLEQLNWDLALDQYQDMVQGKILAVLEDEGYVVLELDMEVEEDAGHVEFGYPQKLEILAQEKKVPDEGFGRVEEIKIELGRDTWEVPRDSQRSQWLERIVATALEIELEKVSVYVLNAD
ncbi:stage III sporulation protein AF [Dethiobacter alkaliphilus]|uniref:stage III sporulation protein AF n=1 Tax=Dethiobacter alkaliphilus TaxID=427926 RepID=UPI002227BC3C|nr:stage III sporulation protein AF [Dethiobacter alkaliphilus]MCW3490276.1 stage III sporulation protein AF [Dethiobacter alkaliphilus]